jgi:1,4-alpha-glucan branching enzyme
VSLQWTLLLHAHLPFVRHPEHPVFLEEGWLYEAISDCYLPLLELLDHYRGRGPLLTLTLSPTLCEMLVDPLLCDRFRARQLELEGYLVRDLDSRNRSVQERAIAEYYLQRIRSQQEQLAGMEEGLIGALRGLQEEGTLEILTCPATHAILPLIKTGQGMKRQLAVARANYEKHFGVAPKGIWLSECAFDPRLIAPLAAEGFAYTILDQHGVMGGTPCPSWGPYRPVCCEQGVSFFARDAESAAQVWSSTDGYPGDPAYREFYRDRGYDEAQECLGNLLPAGAPRHNLGLKFHRITGQDVPLSEKAFYEPELAFQQARQHADHFYEKTASRLRHAQHLADGEPIHILSPYDAELFGHWWFEGPCFLETLFERCLANPQPTLAFPSQVLSTISDPEVAVPACSSWGDKGYFEVWLNGCNDWIYPKLHEAEEALNLLLEVDIEKGKVQERAILQAARELLLAQASDWAFILNSGTVVEYAISRIQIHLERFWRLVEMVRGECTDNERLADMERAYPLFSELSLSTLRR